MEAERANGAGQVARLLRRLADGIDAGEITVEGRRLPCPEDIVAVVDVPPVPHGQLFVMDLRLTGARLTRARALEEELSHPGG